MKKIILLLTISLFFTCFASAQILPSFQFGIKAGANFSTFPQYGPYENKSEPGYIGGVWARVGALGLNFQPEMYVTSKNVNITYTGGNQTTVNPARFTSVDIPLLVGTKIGALGLGARFYGGPVISFAINKNQSFGNDIGRASRLDFNDQNYALQIGAGVDIKKLSIDLRYEAGINKVAYGPDEHSHTRLNLFNLTIAYSIFSIF
jgi:hypothetical protein